MVSVVQRRKKSKKAKHEKSKKAPKGGSDTDLEGSGSPSQGKKGRDQLSKSKAGNRRLLNDFPDKDAKLIQMARELFADQLLLKNLFPDANQASEFAENAVKGVKNDCLSLANGNLLSKISTVHTC